MFLNSLVRQIIASTNYVRRLYDRTITQEQVIDELERQGYMYYVYKRTYIPLRSESKRRN